MIKKLLLIFIAVSNIISAQDFTGLRIYINPGHGGYDSDDRYIRATGFWESEGNLTKGLYLKGILDSLNATTKISRTTNTTDDDLPLSVISADANNFDADFFHSIHSNATGTSTRINSTLILFRGYTATPVFPEAKTLADIVAFEIFKAHRTTSRSIYGDWNFYPEWGTQGLGVLRNLTMPGTLSEGSFHDYIPESWRLKNSAYLKHEAWAITKGFVEYFELSQLELGEIAGILRDPYDEVDYYYISSTDDRRKPLNFVKAVLLPDNLVYEGDDFNNGFFMFDRLPPGTYDLILEAENYEKDTVAAVIVTAGNTAFVDRYLEPKPDFSVPMVNEYAPSETANVRLDTDIILEFNVKMDRLAVEQSFSISPNVIGSFKWESNDRIMIFSPNDYLNPGTSYQITLNTFAKSAFDVFIDQPFFHTFSTRSSLSLVETYPDQNSGNISTTVKIIITFDAPIISNTLGGNISLEDLEGNNVNPLIDETDYQNGKIIFEPLTELENNKFYQIRLSDGIEDIEGSNFNTDTLIVFKTESEAEIDGLVINDFEEIDNWWQPEQSGSTVGVDPDNTSFILSTKKSISGTYSGRLIYEFIEDSFGVCRIYNQSEPTAGTSPNGNFGIWVFGDLSYNLLEYWFRDNAETNIPIFVDTLNWTGWKFIEVDLAGYDNLSFHSIVIKQNSSGNRKGQIYFDTILGDVLVGVDKILFDVIPQKIKLYQNYPNPFNPSTKIRYSLPAAVNSEKSIVKNGNEKGSFIDGKEESRVVLKVYDILGREITTLVDKKQNPGNYEVTWKAHNYPSGIYFYKLSYGDFIDTRKMLLLK